MQNMTNLPIYQALIETDCDGIFAISLVSHGAVELDWQMFAAENGEMQQFAIQDDDEHLLLGCIMRADFNILRKKDDFKYFIRYDRQTIEKMASKMLNDHSFVNVDLQHDGKMLPKGMVELREIFIKDSKKGISPKGFDDVNDGSLFAVYKVNSPQLWELCKQGVFNSFSLEGYFTKIEVKAQKEEDKNYSIMSKIKTILSKILAEFASVKADDGTELFYEGEELEVGKEVADADGNAIADGEYVVEEKTIVVADGKIVEIREKEEEVVEETTEEEIVEAEEEVVEEPVVVEEPAYDAKAEIDALKAEIEALKSEIEAIKAQMVEAVAPPVVEEFEKVNEKKSTGNKKLDRMVEIARALNK